MCVGSLYTASQRSFKLRDGLALNLCGPFFQWWAHTLSWEGQKSPNKTIKSTWSWNLWKHHLLNLIFSPLFSSNHKIYSLVSLYLIEGLGFQHWWKSLLPIIMLGIDKIIWERYNICHNFVPCSTQLITCSHCEYCDLDATHLTEEKIFRNIKNFLAIQ